MYCTICIAKRKFYVLSSARLDFLPGPSNETDLAEDRSSLNGDAQRFFVNFVRPPSYASSLTFLSAICLANGNAKGNKQRPELLLRLFFCVMQMSAIAMITILKNVANGAV
jgi:hypothetical protein